MSAYWNPTRRIIADGALGQLCETAARFHPKKVLLVMGKGSFRGSPHHALLQKGLSGFSVEHAPCVDRSPTTTFIEETCRSLCRERFDLVIGVGGGSVIDAAKALAILMNQTGRSLEDYLEKRMEFQRESLPLIAIPTTAGTGSEVTPYASLKTKGHQKISLTHPWIHPRVALIDPLLTHSMPSYVTACTGLDALSQSIESYWSIHHSPFSDTHALRAIPLILRNLEKVLKDPADAQARFVMALASTESGLAITQTRTTAVHAVSYPLTTFFGIAHGHACALTLPSFIRYNGPVLEPDRGEQLWRVLGVTSWEKAAREVERLIDVMGLERSLRKLGLKNGDLNTVIENGFRSDRAVNNPREVTKEALHEILQSIY